MLTQCDIQPWLRLNVFAPLEEQRMLWVEFVPFICNIPCLHLGCIKSRLLFHARKDIVNQKARFVCNGLYSQKHPGVLRGVHIFPPKSEHVATRASCRPSLFPTATKSVKCEAMFLFYVSFPYYSALYRLVPSASSSSFSPFITAHYKPRDFSQENRSFVILGRVMGGGGGTGL